jgi:hypothetical protein
MRRKALVLLCGGPLGRKATVAALETVCLTGTIAVGAGKRSVDSTADHLVAGSGAINDGKTWFTARFAGTASTGNC